MLPQDRGAASGWRPCVGLRPDRGMEAPASDDEYRHQTVRRPEPGPDPLQPRGGGAPRRLADQVLLRPSVQAQPRCTGHVPGAHGGAARPPLRRADHGDPEPGGHRRARRPPAHARFRPPQVRGPQRAVPGCRAQPDSDPEVLLGQRLDTQDGGRLARGVRTHLQDHDRRSGVRAGVGTGLVERAGAPPRAPRRGHRRPHRAPGPAVSLRSGPVRDADGPRGAAGLAPVLDRERPARRRHPRLPHTPCRGRPPEQRPGRRGRPGRHRPPRPAAGHDDAPEGPGGELLFVAGGRAGRRSRR